MTEFSDTTPAREEPQSCVYCAETGADCCVRMIPSVSGPDRPVHAHQSCATARDERPLYLLVGAPAASKEQYRTCLVCEEPGADVPTTMFASASGCLQTRYAHRGCAAAAASAAGLEGAS